MTQMDSQEMPKQPDESPFGKGAADPNLPFPNRRQSESSLDRLVNQTLFANLKQGLALASTEGVILSFNPSAEKVTGIFAREIVGKHLTADLMKGWKWFDETDDDPQDPVSVVRETGHRFESRFEYRRRDNQRCIVELMLVPLTAPQGGSVGLLVVFQDVTKEQDLQRQLSQVNQAFRQDPLTKVANRTCFEEHLAKAVATSKERNRENSLVICDIDFFKRINDDYGHHAGDMALVEFAAHLSSHVRENDLVARYGGEEFVLILTNCNRDDAARRAEKMRSTLERKKIDALGGRSLTASFGVAEVTHLDNTETLFIRADEALMNAKEQGRNRVLISEFHSQNAHEVDPDPSERPWLEFTECLVQEEYATPTPAEVLIAKIRGFIDEQNAKIGRIDSHHISLVFGGEQSLFRRGSDQALGILADIELRSNWTDCGRARRRGQRTLVRITLHPRNERDRRQKELQQAAFHLLQTLQRYLMLDASESMIPERAATRPGDGR